MAYGVSIDNCVASGGRCALGPFSTLDPVDGSCDVDCEQARCFYNSNYKIWGKFLLWSPALHLRRGTFHILYHKFAVSGRYSQDTREIQ